MTATVTSAPPRRGQSVFWRRFRRSTPGKVGAVIVSLFVLLALLAPLLRPYDPTTDRNYRLTLKPPSITALWNETARETYTDPVSGKVDLWAAPFGTDNLGRDVYARVLHGTRISLKVGVVSTMLALIIGSLLGVFAGFFGGWVDAVAMRLMDIILAFPSLLLAVIVLIIAGRMALGLTYRPGEIYTVSPL